MALDTETHLIRRGLLAPPLVCGSAGWLEGSQIKGILLDKQQTLETFASVLEDPNAIVGGANLPYDLLVIACAFESLGIDVMPEIFKLLEEGRAFDLQLAQALDAVANGTLGRDPRTGGELMNPETGRRGQYSLATCVDLVLGRTDAKANDEYRTRYGELDGTPIDQWPDAARDYPVDDARNSAEAILAQVGVVPKVSYQHTWGNVQTTDGSTVTACTDCGATKISAPCRTQRPHRNLHEMSNQLWSAFGLHLGAAWGFRVDQSAVDVVERYFTRKRDTHVAPFVEAGYLRKGADGYHENQAFVKRQSALAYGATDPCPHCSGMGKIPKLPLSTLVCKACRGRCVSWKWKGEMREPTVAQCEACANTGRVSHPNPAMTGCVVRDENGEEVETSCDGTGLVLTPSVPRAEKGGVAIGRDPLVESGNETLMAYGYFKDDQKILSVYVPFLRLAREPIAGHAENCETLIPNKKKAVCRCDGPYRDIRLTLQPNAVLETGRVSYRGAIMLFPRKPGFVVKDESDEDFGKYIPSLRECIVPSEPQYEYVEVPDDYVLLDGEVVVAC